MPDLVQKKPNFALPFSVTKSFTRIMKRNTIEIIIFFVFAPKARENFEGVYRVRERKIVQIS